ncbi:MAG: SIS domain-containing protein [Elusimicrobiota bacterium]
MRNFDKEKEKLYFYAEERDRTVLDYFGKLLKGVYKYSFAVVNEKRNWALLMDKSQEENVGVNISDLGIEKGDEDKSILQMLVLEGIMEALMSSEESLSQEEVIEKIKEYVTNIVPKIEELKKIDPNKVSRIIKMIVETKLNGHNVFFFGLGESSDINKLLGYDLVKMGVKIPESDRPTRINKEDLVICVSRSGETPELIRDIQSNVIKNRVKTILFTGNENSTIAENLKINPENIIIQIDAGYDQTNRPDARQSYVRRGLEGTFVKPGLPSKDYFHILLAAHFRLLALLTKENLKVVKEVSGQDYSEIFSQSDRVEIGFGKGDFLLEQARKNPTEKWVGIEINEKLASEVNKKAKNEGLKNVKIIGIGSGRENLISLLKEFKSNSLQGICINYPYYWDPKTVDTFINETVAKEFYRLLRINGEVVIVSFCRLTEFTTIKCYYFINYKVVFL